LSAKNAARDGGLATIAAWSHMKVSKGTMSVWGYFYTHVEPGIHADKFGAFHSSEIPYVFGTLDMAPTRGFTLADRKLSLTMSSYWINFVKSGNPNGVGLPTWKPMTGAAPTVMEFEAAQVAERPLLSDETLKVYNQFLASGGRLSMF